MFLATVNKPKQLLYLTFVGDVRPQELAQHQDEVAELLADLKPGFRLLTDLSRMDSMTPDCAPEIGRMMEALDQRGLELIVRIIPDPSKDIGLGILSLFHYPRRPRAVTCKTMVEAAQLLGLPA